MHKNNSIPKNDDEEGCHRENEHDVRYEIGKGMMSDPSPSNGT
jgi:hypothetical protein